MYNSIGCPICGGREGYHWGSDAPCKKCEEGYAKVEKYLPEGTSMFTWYSVKKSAEKALAAGKSKAEVAELMRKQIDEDMEIVKALRQSMMPKSAPVPPQSEHADALFKTLGYNK